MAPITGQNVHDLQRLSVESIKDSVNKDPHTDSYAGGGMPKLTSRDHIGLLFQYAAVGVVYGMLPETIYPFMQQYLNCSGAQVAAAKELVVLPWSFKVFYGIISDCFPIWGYRRRPYMVIGWAICIGMLLIMAILPIGQPYYTDPADRKVVPADYTPEIEARINYDATGQGAKYVVLMFFAAFGYVLSDVCSDSIVCELAQQEPMAKRGKTQSAIYTVRTSSGDSRSLRTIFSLASFLSISYTASSPVQSYLVGVTPINNMLNDVIGHLCFMTGIVVTSKYGLHWDWRLMIIATGIVVIVVDCSVAFITVWDIFRNQWFWLGPPIAVQIPSGVAWIIGLFVTVEIAGTGNEGAIYGLMTTIGNLAVPFATTVTLLINGPFNITNTRVQSDDHSVRVDISYTILISYAMKIFSWAFLVLLPRQKKETQELARTGGSSKLFGGITIGYLSFALVWSVMANTLAIFESTSCLLIAGGKGC
ncbi:unnamed protein product [Peronospora destructor]|uniref:Uncharacterized protein n=1 Tax=Peronospora destructor TaxID=86335 RepID=A0AAV0T8I2_9STRA|nr:unnamed protein product [Peronospora destructor]